MISCVAPGIDVRFDMFVPGTEQPAQAEGVILRPTAK
jgi:hypothetical protein